MGSLVAEKRLGAYAKLSATYYRDDAVLAAGDAAEVLFCRSLAFCAEAGSDGYITDRQVVVIGVGLKGLTKRVASLVTEGVWEKVDGGYVVRSWLKWNRSAEEAGMVRRKDRERKKGIHLVSTRNPDGVTPDSLSESGQVRTGQ